MPTGKNIFERRPLPPDTRKGRGSFARAAGSYVPKIAAKVFEKFGFHSAEIMTEWARVVGPEFASFTQPEKIRWPRVPGASGTAGTPEAQRPGATLVLRVEPARALDAEYRGVEIIDRINRYFGYRAVESLRLVQAPLGTSGSPAAFQPGDVANQKRTKQRTKTRTEPPSGTHGQTPSPVVPETVTDPGLKAALEALWANVSAAGGKD